MKKSYTRELPRQMYNYFIGYDDPKGAPSFAKFARLSGHTVAELKSFRTHREFERAWQECIEIRRDYLIDLAITKRADGSFCKFLLTENSEDGDNEKLDFTLSVLNKNET